jgi:predicted DNA-binding transcriptional regulator AlpA
MEIAAKSGGFLMPEAKRDSNPLNTERLSTHPEYMRPPEAARYTGHSESTLAKLRMRHNRSRGPRFAKLGGVVIYKRADLDAWLDEHMVERDT